MNKIVLALLMISFACPLVAKLNRDPKTCRYYSTPAARDINQEEYHYLYWECRDMKDTAISIFNRAGARIYPQDWIDEIIRYLERRATPTSMRLLNDLKTIGFAI